MIGFTISHLSEEATGGVLLEKVFLEISQNSQEYICGKVSFLIRLQVEATFLFVSFLQKNEMKKRKYTDGVKIFTFLHEYRFV